MRKLFGFTLEDEPIEINHKEYYKFTLKDNQWEKLKKDINSFKYQNLVAKRIDE